MRPLSIAFFGSSLVSAYWNGAATYYRGVLQSLAARGYVVVVPDYRVYPEVKFPDFLSDGAQAVRWAHDNAAKFGGDPARLFVMGHSAGAHLAALVCTDDRYLQAEGLSLSIVKGCVPVDTAAYDIPQRFAQSDAAKASAV